MLWRDLIETLEYLKEIYKKDDLVKPVVIDNGFKLLEKKKRKGRFRLDIVDIGRNYLQRG